MQRKELLDVINLNCNACRVDLPPVEATVYSFQAKGRDVNKFISTSEIELTVEVGNEMKTETLAIPLDLFREDMIRVTI